VRDYLNLRWILKKLLTGQRRHMFDAVLDIRTPEDLLPSNVLDDLAIDRALVDIYTAIHREPPEPGDDTWWEEYEADALAHKHGVYIFGRRDGSIICIHATPPMETIYPTYLVTQLPEDEVNAAPCAFIETRQEIVRLKPWGVIDKETKEPVSVMAGFSKLARKWVKQIG
jgi:hypothetical protein